MKLIAVFNRTILKLFPLVLVMGTHSLTGAAYIKLEGIDGEAKDERRRGWSDMTYMDIAIEREEAIAGGGGAGKVSFLDISCHKELDKATPKLFQSCATGEPIPSVQIALERSSGADGGKVEYLVITLTDVIVSSVSTRGSATGDDVPTEDFSLNYGKIKMEYTPINDDGAPGEVVSFSWNVAENTPE